MTMFGGFGCAACFYFAFALLCGGPGGLFGCCLRRLLIRLQLFGEHDPRWAESANNNERGKNQGTRGEGCAQNEGCLDAPAPRPAFRAALRRRDEGDPQSFPLPESAACWRAGEPFQGPVGIDSRRAGTKFKKSCTGSVATGSRVLRALCVPVARLHADGPSTRGLLRRGGWDGQAATHKT